MDEDMLTWLLGGDPAVRWRVLRDLTGARDEEVARERERVAAEGWGARLLAEQHADGGWGEGDYSPKWTSTTYTMLHLLWLGLPAGHPAVLRGCARLWDWQQRWRTPETCIAGMLIRLTNAFRYDAERLDELVRHLAGEQLDDGGWNCKSRGDKSMHSSFHTSIQALEALDAYRRAGGTEQVGAAIGRGHEFFLRHRLYQSHRTGAVAIPASTKFPVFRSGISTSCGGWSTSRMPARRGTTAWRRRSGCSDGHDGGTDAGRRTPGMRASSSSGWRSRGRAD